MQTLLEVSRTDSEVTFEYRTIFSYWMYGSLMAYISALAFDAPRTIEHAAIGVMFLYFVVVFIPSRSTTKKLQRAMKESAIRMEGSRWSFSNPLRITMPLAYADESAVSDSTQSQSTDGEG